MRHRGFTLIEMIAAMTVGSVMLAVGVGLLHVLMKAGQTGGRRIYQTQVLASLAKQFRSDVHAATGQAPGQADRPDQWQFTLTDDRVVTYRAMPGEIQWSERAADKQLRQESYVLPSDCSAAIVVQGDAKEPLASLVVTGDGAHRAAGSAMRVTALLGKDHRFAKSTGGGR